MSRSTRRDFRCNKGAQLVSSKRIEGFAVYIKRRCLSHAHCFNIRAVLFNHGDDLGRLNLDQRSLKIQAGKARRYSEFTEELKRKRLVGALARYSDLTKRRESSLGELEEIGRVMGLSRERVRQIEAQALQRLFKLINSDRF